MAGATGLEPAASCVTGRRSNQLNYAPAWDKFILLIIVLSDAAWLLQVSSNSLPFHLDVP
jgi:hypothetical protein